MEAGNSVLMEAVTGVTRESKKVIHYKMLRFCRSCRSCAKLTDKIINRMKKFYVIAIRQNTLSSQKKSVLAILWHYTDIADKQERHQFSPRESNQWCKYWENSGSGYYKASVNLPKVVNNLLVQILLDLRDDNLLSRCLDRTIQNSNKVFNQFNGKNGQGTSSFQGMC